MTTVFIDGSAGTTGLRIHSRLADRSDLSIITLTGDDRKDPAKRREALNSCDFAMLCLPDAASVEAVGMIENSAVRVIDTSTAHRVAAGWAYGFPELDAARRCEIASTKRLANPGCHASGFISCVYPLVAHGLVPSSFPFSCVSLTGFSGGGKALIAEYEDAARTPVHGSDRVYGLALNHKHLPEMKALCGLDAEPVFVPVVGDYYSGMATTVMLPGYGAEAVWELMAEHYAGCALVRVAPLGGDAPVIYSGEMSGRDSMTITVSGNSERAIVTSLFDNLGKGASGAAIQNLNIMLGVDETTGLVI